MRKRKREANWLGVCCCCQSDIFNCCKRWVAWARVARRMRWHSTRILTFACVHCMCCASGGLQWYKVRCWLFASTAVVIPVVGRGQSRRGWAGPCFAVNFFFSSRQVNTHSV